MADDGDDGPFDFDEWIAPLRVRAGQLYRALAAQGIRIFNLSLGPHERKWHWMHDQKSVEAWRADVREFLASDEATGDDAEGGHAGSGVINSLAHHLRSLGYVEVDDVVADVFEGRITDERARLTHDPLHEEQPDGFGHYGWENGRGEEPR